MSTVSVSYSSLWDASREAKDVAKKLDKYADQLHDRIVKKLDKYNGSWTSNLSTAKSQTNQKISELRREQTKYENFSKSLVELRQDCKDVDGKVRNKVSTLTAQFKESHGIKNHVIIDYMRYLFISRVNTTAAGRWINDRRDETRSSIRYVKDRIKEWYGYEGGKEFLKGALVAILEIVIAVCVLVSPANIFALIGAAIALVSGCVNLANEIYGLMVSGEDPATGRRRSGINSLTEWIRKDFDSKFAHGIAGVIDVVNFIASIGNIMVEGWGIIKKAYNWFKGGGIAKTIANGSKTWTDIMAAFRNNKGWESIMEFARGGLKDLLNNFMDDFLDGKTISPQSIKNITSVVKDLFKGENLAAAAGLVLPFFGESISDIGDMIFDEILSEKIKESPMFKDSPINSALMEKLSEISDIRISVPDVPMPEIPHLSLEGIGDIKFQAA